MGQEPKTYKVVWAVTYTCEAYSSSEAVAVTQAAAGIPFGDLTPTPVECYGELNGHEVEATAIKATCVAAFEEGAS